MKKRIVVEHGEVKRMALMRGGSEVGDEPVNNGNHESGLVKTV